MVWFQCEDCGNDLKKPKLAGHIRSCSAYRLSCIDCGEFFTQEIVQGHTQCISEAEKYGPKGQNKASMEFFPSCAGDNLHLQRRPGKLKGKTGLALSRTTSLLANKTCACLVGLVLVLLLCISPPPFFLLLSVHSVRAHGCVCAAVCELCLTCACSHGACRTA